MATTTITPLAGRLRARAAEYGAPIAVLGIIIALITPLPGAVLDLLIVIDIMLSVTVLMVSMYIRRPVEFNVFPTTLLLLTLFRLSLNISATRLILMNGNSGTTAAGAVIEAFGNFVVGGNYVIGVIIFLALVAIQYVVINHGAVRISEVTARFTLDALPGKQMSIDSDLAAGLIDEATARERRKQLALEAEFYGSMDGATRFTQRDALASVLITGINIIGGFLIGVFQHGMNLQQALQTYTVLTIGDGLVTVIPALMVSISGGLVVTRATSEERLTQDFQRQLFGSYQPLLLASAVLLVLAAFPGLPRVPFLLVGATLGATGWNMRKQVRQRQETPVAAPPATSKDTVENLEKLLRVEPLSVGMGVGLVRLVKGDPDASLLKRLTAMRRQLASELGYLVPPIRFNDNMSLRSREYVVYLKGIEIARYEIPANCELAIPGSNVTAQIEGQPTRDPAFDSPALWIPPSAVAQARHAGYMVVDPISVIGTHLFELIKRHAHEMFSRQDMKKVLDRVAEEHPKVVEELTPKLLPLSVVHKVFQNLLRERVSIRDAVSILEALGEAALSTRNHVLLTEYVRQAVRRAIVAPFLNNRNELPAFFVDPSLEDTVAAGISHAEQNSHLNLSPKALREVLNAVQRSAGNPRTPTAVLTSATVRFFMQQICESTFHHLYFLSHNEIPPAVRVVSLGIIQ